MKITKELKVFEGFAGYGGASFALKRLKDKFPDFEYNVVAYSEIDKFAIRLFNANHKDKNGENIGNFGDITTINPNDNDFPKFDLFTGGFCCQPFSIAGMQMGIEDKYGRGNLFEHIANICEVIKPKYILLENVKGFLNKKFDQTREYMFNLFRNAGYVSDKNNPDEPPFAIAVLNSLDYGIPQNRERVWMFARLGGLPKNFNLVPPKQRNEFKLADFLDPIQTIPSKYYLSEEQIKHLKDIHNIDSFIVDTPLCFDVYNKRIRWDGYSMTLTMPEHNSIRIIEPHNNKEVIRKMTPSEQFRLMGLESLNIEGRNVDIDLSNLSYLQLSKKAANGWDVNLVTILLEHIFKQLGIL